MNRSPTLAFLATDLVGSSTHWEANTERMSFRMQMHDALVREAVAANEGRVVKGVGDGFLAVFSRASDALSTAGLIQAGLTEADWNQSETLRIRMAIHCGTAEERDGDFFGNTVNRTARILSVGKPGQLILSHSAYTLLEEDLASDYRVITLGNRRLRGMARRQLLYAIPLSSMGAAPKRRALRPRSPWLIGAALILIALIAGSALFLLNKPKNRAISSGHPVRSQAWRQDGHDATHSGYDPHEWTLNPDSVRRLHIVWDVRKPFPSSPTVWSSATVVSGLVFVGSNLGTWAIRANNGVVVWRANTGDTSASAPCVAGDSVFVGNARGQLFALSTKRGSVVWSRQTQPSVKRPAPLTSPTVVGDSIFVGSIGGSVWAFHSTLGNGQLIWTANQGTHTTSPTVDHGTVYLGSAGGVQAVNGSSGAGRSAWGPGFTPHGQLFSAPSVAGQGLFVNASLRGKKSRRGLMYGLRRSNGRPMWRYPPSGSEQTPFSQPAVAQGFVYVASSSGRVLRLDANTGRVSWTFPLIDGASTGDSFWWRPSIANGVVFVAGASSTREDVYALAARNGTELWHFQKRRESNGTSFSASEPAISGGRLFVTYSSPSRGSGNSAGVLAFAMPSTHKQQTTRTDH